jgi:hypothetical protein
VIFNMQHSLAVTIAVLGFASSGLAAAGDDPGLLVRALWLVQRYGTADAVDPRNDQRVKGQLFKALGKEGELTFTELRGLMDADTFKKLAGADDRIDAAEIKVAADSAVPESRTHLLPRIRQHADSLTTSFDMIDEPHRVAGHDLAEWIATHYRPGQKLQVTMICTGNSRRSILGSTMGNVAAAYCGMPEICFHSGGTAPTACNSRTVTALREIGVQIEPTGKEAARGEPKTENPVYRIRWGTSSGDGAAFEAVEFSKKYDDPANPQQGFAALMVCGEADEACPVVKGASRRISMPYLDPKIYDGSAFEAAKYGERRDDMGRLMLSAMMQARQRLASTGQPGKAR